MEEVVCFFHPYFVDPIRIFDSTFEDWILISDFFIGEVQSAIIDLVTVPTVYI